MPKLMGDVRADQNVAMGSDVSDSRLNTLISPLIPDPIQGESGYSGYSGSQGVSGLSGASGRSGFSGIAGVSGGSGSSGSTGVSGISGFAGLSYDTFCTSYRDKLTTVNATPVTARTLTMTTNSLMFVDVIATFQDTATHLTGGYIWATLSFARASGAPVGLGTLDILESHNLNGPAVNLNISGNDIIVVVEGKASTSISWSLRTTADRGNP